MEAANFITVPSVKSGFKVNGDAKAVAKLRSVLGDELIIATQNRDSLRVFRTVETVKSQRYFSTPAF